MGYVSLMQMKSKAPKPMKRPWNVIFWWEIRRVQYNIVLAGAGFITVVVVLATGEKYADHFDFEPSGLAIGVILYGLAANIAYTLGWITELLWFAKDNPETVIRRRRIFRLGLVGSLALTLAPSVMVPAFWMTVGRTG